MADIGSPTIKSTFYKAPEVKKKESLSQVSSSLGSKEQEL